MEKAAGKTEYDGAVKKTKERMQDIDDTVTFLQAGGPSTPAAAVSTRSGSRGRRSSGGAAAAPAGVGAAPAASGSTAARRLRRLLRRSRPASGAAGDDEVLADAETFAVTLVSLPARRCRDGESR